jgi:disintegrin and metalloproteinase domain-containing protein 17
MAETGRGSTHDETSLCVGDSSSGKFIMSPYAVDGSKGNNYLFSSCSKTLIANVINAKGSCFSMPPAGICGNRIVEGSEQCDTGSGDACCTSTCELTPGSNCSDVNNPCCSNCQANIGAECFTPFEGDSQCRDTGFCAFIDFEVGCPNPPPSKAVKTPCSIGGRCDGLEHSADARDRCIPFCKRFGGIACTCTGSDECSVCCKHNVTATCDASTCQCPFVNATGCVRAAPFITAEATGNDPECYADDATDAGTIVATLYINNPQSDTSCVDTSAVPCLHVLNSIPGTSCSIGTCNRQGECAEQDSQIARAWCETISKKRKSQFCCCSHYYWVGMRSRTCHWMTLRNGSRRIL